MQLQLTNQDYNNIVKYKGTQKMVKETGKVITIHSYLPKRGTFEGEVCDMIKYKQNGVTRVIEAPKVEL